MLNVPITRTIMKTLILSDIHGNLPALEAVLAREKNYDRLLFLGDVVDYGPFPHECIEFLQKNMDVGVTGNHDNAIAHNVDCGCRGDFKTFSEETRAWHKTLLTDSDIQFLRSLRPLQKTTINGLSALMAHATPEGDLFHYLQESEVDKAVEHITDSVVLIGHTHIQFQKQVGDTLVVNPGSVGLSRDGGDACYAIFESDEAQLCRVPYDVEKTIRALNQSPVSLETKEGLARVLHGKKFS